MIRRVLAGAVVVGMLAGCDALHVPPRTSALCTLIGCESQVRVELDADLTRGVAYEIVACLDETCVDATVEIPTRGAGVTDSLLVDIEADTVVLILPEGDYSGSHSASLTLVGADVEPIEIQVETDFERSQPNGPNCPPVCWLAIVRG